MDLLIIAIVSVILFLLLNLLLTISIKLILSGLRCECSKQRKISWKVAFNPCLLFALSEEEFYLWYSGKCKLCGRNHKALLEFGGITLIT